MSRIINDFIESAKTHDGYGFFEGQGDLVVKYSEKISKSQLRQYKRYKKIPSALNAYLLALHASPKKVDRALADHMGEQILKNLYPDTVLMFGSGPWVWKKLKEGSEIKKA